jgi:hypothetical protein
MKYSDILTCVIGDRTRKVNLYFVTFSTDT